MSLKAIIALVFLAFAIEQIQAGVQWTGVNLAGGGFDGCNCWPRLTDVDYFAAKGMNIFRISFAWERLQPSLNGSFATQYAAELHTLVTYSTSKGVYVLLDVHNYARYKDQVIGGGTVTNAHFADLWIKLALKYKTNSKVLFGLMNEPKQMPNIQWRNAAQVAVNAIRGTGATNYILLPGNGFSGAWSWFQGFYDQGAIDKQSNAQVMTTVTDPLNKMIFEVHQYFDSDSSGTHDTCNSPPVGNSTLDAFTFWLRANKKRAFLGEFGVPNNANCLKALGDAVMYMHQNSDVWLGWTVWSAGYSWGDYAYSIQPTNNYTVDKPHMAVLKPYLHGLGAVSISIPARITACVNQTIYDDKLRNGWQNWSWASKKNFSDTSLKQSGSSSISFIPENYGALSFSLDTATFSTSLYSGVEFYINGAPNGGQSLRYGVRKNKTEIGSPKQVNINNYLATGTRISNTWTRVYVPLSANGITANNAIQSITIGSTTAAAQGRVYIDNIKLVCINQPATTSATSTVESDQPSEEIAMLSSASSLCISFGLLVVSVLF